MMQPTRKFGLLVSLVMSSLLFGFAYPAHAELGDVSVGGVWVCRFSKGANGFGLEQRMEQIERNIYTVVNNPKYRGQRQVPVQVRPVGQGAALTVDGIVVFVITPEDVEGTGAKAWEAAQQWAPKLSRGLSQAIPDGSQTL